MPNGVAAPVIATGASESVTSEYREDWRVRAACRHTEPELFFPVQSSDKADTQAALAKAVCKACTVRRECLQFALATRQSDGIWGGMSERERHVVHARGRTA
jgi:WhiB family transcriptional regulator, redox-sensing transcriptional regulator